MDNEEKKRVICAFLEKCVTYADESISRKKKRGEDAEEISRWEAYREFTEHAIKEVEAGELDSWLD